MNPILHPETPTPNPGPIPTLVLGGYLGAGKTTLVNHLLRHAGGRRIAVMVNDFGEIGIDADLILSSDGEVMQLAGGCICCSVGSDLMSALMTLGERTPRPELLLIETSGVALPGSVARSARLAPGIVIDGVVVLADALSVQSLACDRHVGDTVLAQLREADLLVINKLDELPAEALPGLQQWISHQAPRARIITAIEADIPPELVLGMAGAELRVQSLSHPPGRLFAGDRPARQRIAPGRGAATTFESASFMVARPLDAQALIDRLSAPERGLVRVKGLVHDLQRGLVVVQAVGARTRMDSAPIRVSQGAANPGRVVVIGLKGRIDHQQLEALIAECMPHP